MSTLIRLLELLEDLKEPSSSIHIRATHDGRTIAAAEKRGFIMEYVSEDRGPMFLRTEQGTAFLVVEEIS